MAWFAVKTNPKFQTKAIDIRDDRMMLVTGAAGFIGSHLVDRLLHEGFNVVGVDKTAPGERRFLHQAMESPSFKFFQCDLSDSGSVATLENFVRSNMKVPIDTVWHLAANSDIASGIGNPRLDLHDTFMTTFEILQMMKRLSIPRIVFSSTSAVYGETRSMMHEESGLLFPISAYGSMKLASEASISAAVEAHLESAFICRLPNVVGSRATHGVIYDLLGKLKKRRDALDVLGNGFQKKPYLHVSEVIAAMMFIWKNARQSRSVYNIGPKDDGVEVRDIANVLLKAAHLDIPLRFANSDRGWVGDVPRFSLSIKKLVELGWEPQTTSIENIRRAAIEIAAEFGF
jgi:UDP-glucose 4-epimerase